MKKFLTTILYFTIFTLMQNVWAAPTYNIKDRIDTQHYYLKVYPLLFGQADFALMKDFKKALGKLRRSKRNTANKFITEVESFIPKRVLMPLVYWKYIKPSQANVAEVINFHMLYRLLILRDALDNPIQLSVDQKYQVLSYLKDLTGMSHISSANLFNVMQPKLQQMSQSIAKSNNLTSYVAALKGNRLVAEDMQAKHSFIPNYALSYLGIVPGNQVEVVSKNDPSKERIDWFNQRVVFNGGKLDWSQPFMKMPLKPGDEGHIAFQEDPIFQRIRDMITRAKDSIFIDIFLFGGTMGATLTKYLIDQTLIKRAENPRFKTLLLHDYATNYNMWPEMKPVFVYIRDRIANEPEVKACVSLLQANIQRHPPGIPFGISNLIPKTEEVFKEIEKRNTYYESKIDHSKVIVIDANTDHPEAYFGSKNWTDHSGGYYYDNAIWVKGPVAALVQDSYYDDVEAALTEDPKERKWFFYKEEGFGNDHYLPRKTEILQWVKVKKTTYPMVGNQSVRLAEANVDGKIKNVRNILIDMIQGAQKNIYMEQLFLYDSYVADALIKRKIQVPSLDIKISMDPNGNFGFNGLPNTIYIKELVEAGIEIKTRTILGTTAHFPNGKTQTYHQENHRKITSVDGKVLLGGSSNINPDTLQGSFREFGAQIFDPSVISKFEVDFLTDWNDTSKSELMDIYNLQLKLGKKVLSKETSALINNLAGQILRVKDDLERRY